jgi:hypothetical protein
MGGSRAERYQVRAVVVFLHAVLEAVLPVAARASYACGQREAGFGFAGRLGAVALVGYAAGEEGGGGCAVLGGGPGAGFVAGVRGFAAVVAAECSV